MSAVPRYTSVHSSDVNRLIWWSCCADCIVSTLALHVVNLLGEFALDFLGLVPEACVHGAVLFHIA